MQLILDRLHRTRTFTLGTISIDGVFEAYTKEPPARSDYAFIPGESGLPWGDYTISLPVSGRYGMPVPLAVSSAYMGHGGARVAFGMRFLPGQGHDDGIGILLGQEQGPTDLYRTRAAYEAFFKKLNAAHKCGQAIELLIRSQ